MGGCLHNAIGSSIAGNVKELLTYYFCSQIREDYADIRQDHLDSLKDRSFLSLAKARSNSLKLNFSSLPPVKPSTTSLTVLKDYDLNRLLPYIDWKPFFDLWQLRGKYPNRGYPNIFKDKTVGKEALKLYEEAQILLKDLITNNKLTANGVFRIFPANSVQDDIILFSEDLTTEVGALYGLRQQEEKIGDLDEPYLCLSDFVAPKTSGVLDYVGMFVVSVGFGVEELCAEYLSKQDVYNDIMVKSLADRLVLYIYVYFNLIRHNLCTQMSILLYILTFLI